MLKIDAYVAKQHWAGNEAQLLAKYPDLAVASSTISQKFMGVVGLGGWKSEVCSGVAELLFVYPLQA